MTKILVAIVHRLKPALVAIILACSLLTSQSASSANVFAQANSTQTKPPLADDLNVIFKALKWRSIGPFRGGSSNCAVGCVGVSRTYCMVNAGVGLCEMVLVVH